MFYLSKRKIGSRFSLFFALTVFLLPSTGQTEPLPLEKDEPASLADNRFSLTPTKDGFLRLDKKTGAVSICKSDNNGDWSCKPVADDDEFSESQISELKSQNEEILSELNALRSFANRLTQQYLKQNDDPSLKLPNKKEVDDIADLIEHTLRRFKDMMERMDEGKPPSHRGPKI